MLMSAYVVLMSALTLHQRCCSLLPSMLTCVVLMSTLTTFTSTCLEDIVLCICRELATYHVVVIMRWRCCCFAEKAAGTPVS